MESGLAPLMLMWNGGKPREFSYPKWWIQAFALIASPLIQPMSSTIFLYYYTITHGLTHSSLFEQLPVYNHAYEYYSGDLRKALVVQWKYQS